ncbi:MAG: GNAT family N-acetyltransferase [Myxococcota bacterium]
MNLRPAVRADLDAVLPLLLQLADNGHHVDIRYRLRGHRRALLRAHVLESWFGRFMPFPSCWVAEKDDTIVGMVSGEPLQMHAVLDQPPTVVITDLWIEPGFRRRGLARSLVDRFCRTAEEAGYPRVEVSTLARDAQALAFWRAMGFADLRIALSREAEEPSDEPKADDAT